MNENPTISPFERIAHKLDAFSRRERMLVSMGFVLGLGAVLGLVASAMSLGANGGLSVSSVMAIGLGILVLGLSALGLVVGLKMYQAQNRLRQARLTEDVESGFRFRLVTIVESFDRPKEGASAELLEWTGERVAGLLEPIKTVQIHPLVGIRRVFLFCLASMAMVFLLNRFGEPGPKGLLEWLDQGRENSDLASLGEGETVVGEAIVGEILLRYTYPEYTDIAPMEVPNSNGMIHGPPGTQVRIQARTAEVYERSAIRVLEEPLVQAELVDGRDLKSELVVLDPGNYQFHFFRSDLNGVESEFLSPLFQIEVEPDDAPTVELMSTSDRLEIEHNGRLPLAWSARDDFGLDKIVAVLDGKEVLIRDPAEASASLDGAFRKTPQELGLQPGQEVELLIRAWDNDAVSGSKPGESRAIRIKVLGAKASQRRMMRLWRELRNALLDMLAEHVTDPDPPANNQSDLLVWAGEAAARLDPVDALVDQYWDAFQSSTVESLIVDEVRRVSGSLLRFAQSISSAQESAPIRAADLASLSELREDLLERSEQAILMLDQMVRYQALGKLNQLAQNMAQQGSAMEERNKKKASIGEMLGRLDSLERQAALLRDAAKDFNGGDLSEFVERSLDDAERLMERMREMVSEEDEKGARARVPQLAETLRMMAAGVDHQQRQMESEGEETESLIEELKKELERLEAEERSLQEDTVAAREQNGAGQGSLVDLWKQAEALVVEAVENSRSAAVGVAPGLGFSPQESTTAEQGADQVERLQQAVGGRDLDGSKVELSRSQLRNTRALETLRWRESRRDQIGRGIPQADGLEEQLNKANSALARLEVLLRRLDSDLNASSPGLQAASQKLSSEQNSLQGETQSAQALARQLSEKLPMGAPGLNEGMEGAVREMERATESLRRARTVEAEGAEGAAADRLRQAREALDQAAAAMAQMQEAMRGQGQQGGERPDGQDKTGEERRQDPIEIPAPEEFQSPEAYRKALLEGMQGDVPSEFEALKRRYYEELVRQ
jgi:hypothetical protein